MLVLSVWLLLVCMWLMSVALSSSKWLSVCRCIWGVVPTTVVVVVVVGSGVVVVVVVSPFAVLLVVLCWLCCRCCLRFVVDVAFGVCVGVVV